MKKHLLLVPLLFSSPLLAHPGHGSMPLGEAWLELGAAALLALAGLLAYRSYVASKSDDD